MSCPNCGTAEPEDRETGHGGDLCPDCQADGFTYTHHGELVNVDEQYEADLSDPRRI